MTPALKYLLLILLLGCASIKSSALLNADSLQTVLNKTKTDSTTLQSYLQLFSDLNSNENEAKAVIGNWLVLRSTQSKNNEILAKTYHVLGIMYFEANDDVMATEYWTKSLNIAEENNLHHVTARALNSLGLMHYRFKQLDVAIDHFKRAIEAGMKSSKTTGIGMIYGNLGGIYRETGWMSEDTVRQGLAYSLKGLSIAESENDTAGIIDISNGISYLYIDLGELDSALAVLERSENLIRLTNDDQKFMTHYLRVGQLYDAKGEHNKATEVFMLGLSYAKKYKNPRWEYNYYIGLSDNYEHMGDYKNANKYNLLYSSVHDSLVTVENFAMAADIQKKYETEKKEKEILELKKETTIQALELAKENEIKNMFKIIIASIVVILLLLIFLTIFLIRTNSERKKVNQKLHEKNIEIQNQSDKLSEQAKLISKYQSQMNPHFIFNALNSIQGFVVNDDKEKTINQLQYFSILMRETLNNSEQENITLKKEIDYLKTYVAFEQVKFANKINFEIELPEDVNSILIPAMMIQPFIENSIKHAGFHSLTNPEVSVKISIVDELLKISISDNGKGINLADDKIVKNSHALSIIQSRLKIIFKAAEKELRPDYFEIISDSSKKPGTEIVFYLPLLYNY